MGKIKQGLLGPVAGKVGNVVGATWRGIDYLRIMPANVNDPQTPAQMSQRTKFLLVLRFLQPLLDFLKIGFRGYAKGMSAFNAAMSYNLKNAVTGEYPDHEVAFADVLVSRGTLRSVSEATASSPAAQTIAVAWDDNSEMGNASASDNAMLVVFNADKMDVVWRLQSGTREEASAQMTVPASYVGDTV